MESERLHGYPDHFTAPVLNLVQDRVEAERKRQSLIGNCGHLSVAHFWVQQLVMPALAQLWPPFLVSISPPCIRDAIPVVVPTSLEKVLEHVGVPDADVIAYVELVGQLSDRLARIKADCSYIQDRPSRGL